MDEALVKVRIELPDNEDGVGGESFWSRPIGDDLFEVHNSLWHTLKINYLDVVRAIAPDEESKPVFIEVVHRRGHRTIHLIFLDEGEAAKETVLAKVKELGATIENCDGFLYAIDLAPEIDFDPVADYLIECEEVDWLSVAFADQPQPMGTGDLVH